MLLGIAHTLFTNILFDVLSLDAHALFTNTIFDVSVPNVEVILDEVRFCNPPTLLLGSLFAMIFLSPELSVFLSLR